MRASRPSLIHKLRVDAHAAWLVARDRRCPWPARVFGLFITAYAFSPIDLIPDFIPIVGLIDDALVIPAGLWLFVRMLPTGLLEEHRAVAEAASERPGSAVGALIVILLWIGAAAGIAWLWEFHYS